MTVRSRHVVFLAAAVVMLAAVVVAIVSGLTLRRTRRDFTFGLEELDILIADGFYEEADAMLPWLAERAQTAGEGLRIVKRAHALFNRSGSARGMDAAARRLLHEFPANPTIRSVAVYTAVRAGHRTEALAMASGELGEAAPVVYAWALLKNRDSPPAIPAIDQPEREDDEMLLARLGSSSSAAEYERAWRLTGDERYALGAVLLLLLEDPEAALELALGAGLRRDRPLLVADLLCDRGRFDEAISLLSGLASTEPDVLMRLAEAHYHAGDDEEAMRIYRKLVDEGARPGAAAPPHEAYINLAHLEALHPESAAAGRPFELLERAMERYPESWPLARAVALARSAAGSDPPQLTPWFATAHEAEARLLALQLEEDPDRRGYEADLWMLLERFPGEDAFRYAAWYFTTREKPQEVDRVLQWAAAVRDEGEGEPAWSRFFRGLSAARADRWQEAAGHFTASFVRSPSWQSALNAAIALLRTGSSDEARTRLDNALLLARYGKGEARDGVFLTAARLESGPAERRRLVDEALAIRPASPEALLLRAQFGTGTRGQLENAGAR